MMLSYVFMCVSSLQSGSPLRIQTIQPPSLLPASAAVLFSGAAGVAQKLPGLPLGNGAGRANPHSSHAHANNANES